MSKWNELSGCAVDSFWDEHPRFIIYRLFSFNDFGLEDEKMRKLTLISFIIVLILFFLAAKFFPGDELGSKEYLVLTAQKTHLLGDPNAPHVLVEFFDPACESCKHFAPIVKKLPHLYQGKLAVVLRCRPLHPQSDIVCLILEALGEQGLFWQGLEKLYEEQNNWASHHSPNLDKVLSLAQEIALDREKLANDLLDPKLKMRIQQDIEDGQSLQIQQTPSFFLDHKRLSIHSTRELLEKLANFLTHP